ncbi:MAG: MarR family transcriptional regulator [Spirosomataceae bacterium]
MTTDLAQRAYFFKIDTTVKKIRHTMQKKLDHAGLNLTVDQWVLIDHIEKKQGLSQIELAEITVKDGPTVTRIIDLLVEKGLVERRMPENDRRKFGIYLTSAGQEKYEQAFPIIAEVRQLGWNHLSDEDYYNFVRILDTVYQNIISHSEKV